MITHNQLLFQPLPVFHDRATGLHALSLVTGMARVSVEHGHLVRFQVPGAAVSSIKLTSPRVASPSCESLPHHQILQAAAILDDCRRQHRGMLHWHHGEEDSIVVGLQNHFRGVQRFVQHHRTCSEARALAAAVTQRAKARS